MFRLSISEDYYKPTLVKTGYSGNYTKYESKGDKILTVKEYLSLIEPYLAGMINDYKSKGEWKVQLTAETNFISLKPGSDDLLCKPLDWFLYDSNFGALKVNIILANMKRSQISAICVKNCFLEVQILEAYLRP